MLNNARRGTFDDGRLRDAQVAACSNAIALDLAAQSDDLWCGSPASKPRSPKTLAYYRITVIGCAARVGKSRVLAG